MVTEQFIRKRFIHQILSRDMVSIYNQQSQTLRGNFKNPLALSLASMLSSHPYGISGNGLSITYQCFISPYLRFLDIKYSHALNAVLLYNKVVWRTLYRHTWNDLRYGLTEDIRKEFRKRFESAAIN